jgi:hypothetical protein
MSVFFLLICSFILSFTLQKSDAVSRQLVCFYLFLILPPTINTYWFTASLFKPHVIPTHCVDHMDCDYVSVFLEFSFVQESFYIYIYTQVFQVQNTHTSLFPIWPFRGTQTRVYANGPQSLCRTTCLRIFMFDQNAAEQKWQGDPEYS